MPIDVASGRRLAQQLHMTPPADWNPDEWYVQMLQNAVDSGDPRALKAAGLWTGAEAASEVGGRNVEQGYATDYMNAAPSSEWMGKRKPTPRELRRYAADSRQSEDYARFSDAQLANWINKSWDAQQGAFFNDYGDRVEKPTESGAMSHAAGAATGQRGVGPQGGGGYGGGAAAAPAAAAPAAPKEPALTSPLQDLLMNQGGYLRPYDTQVGNNTPGVQGGVIGGSNQGGIWYQRTPSWGASPAGTGVLRGGGPSPVAKPVGTPVSVGAGPADAGRNPIGYPTPVGGLGQPGQPGALPPGKTPNPLATTLAGYQGQQPLSPLSAMLQPYQIKNRRAGSGIWF